MLTIGAVALIVVLAAVGAAALVDRSGDVAEAEAARHGAEVATSVVAGISEAASALEAAGRIDLDRDDVDRDARRAALLPALSVVEFVPLEGRPLVVPAALLETAPVREALSRARDTRHVVLSGPVGSSPASAVMVRARYDRSAGDLPSRSTAARRAALSGFVVGVVDAEALVDGTGAQLSDAGIPLSTGELDGSTADAGAPVLDRRWVVTVGVERSELLPAWTLLALAAGAIALVLAAGRWWRRLAQKRSREAAAARDRAAAVMMYAGVVQESHDLGEVVPALAVQVCDRLGLAGMSLSTAQEDGSLREVFVHGELPNRAITPMTVAPSEAGASDTVALHLRRAERSIGVLRVRCGRPLDAGDLDQLRIVAELVTSTVVASRSLEQQREAVDRLRSVDELKTAFLGTASHELRTPVTAISGFAYMLSDRWDSLPEQQRKVFADRIASNARVLDSLVQDLLDFARLERGALRLALEPVDLAAVVERVLDRLEPVWSSHTVARTVEHGVSVVGDAPALERVVTNLVSNAVKFSPEGSVVSVRVQGGEPVCLTIDDEGPGVPTGDRDRIFVRFFRGDGDAVMRTSGVGIGLAVVKDYVTQMGGEIRVETSPAGGARFVVELRAATEHFDEELETSDVTT